MIASGLECKYMAYVPGYQHDVFVSYAHGDDRLWVNRFVERLQLEISRLIGEVEIWFDKDDLRKSSDYRQEIPDRVRSSGVFLLLTSPKYIRSPYCIPEECVTFAQNLPVRRQRFASDAFRNDRFVFRCPILPIAGDEQNELFPGVSDSPFCDRSGTFPMGSEEFESAFRQLVNEIQELLCRMRNHCTPVFLYPMRPAAELKEVHEALAAELAARCYRVLPDRYLNLAGQLREASKASLSVFLMGADFDDETRKLTNAVADLDRPRIVWCSPEAQSQGSAKQSGFCRHLEQLDSPRKTYLDPRMPVHRIKDTVLGMLDARSLFKSQEKPTVYLIYNFRDRTEKGNAGLIEFHYDNEFQFAFSDDPGQHSTRLTNSAGVLLVWGSSDEQWCSPEFDVMVRTARLAGSRGMCLFDPEGRKRDVIPEIQRRCQELQIECHFLEQFGRFDPVRLEPFFRAIRRAGGGE